MKLKLLPAILFTLFAGVLTQAGTEEETALIAYQQKIDDAVVRADLAFLQNAFADDFRFKHSTGKVDNKESWLKDAEKNRGDYVSREHFDVEAEIHGAVGITHGKLRITRKTQAYAIGYVRVYVRTDGQWRMISHRSVQDLKP